MKWVYKIIRALIMTALILAILIPVAGYVVVTLPPIQDKMREVAESELSTLLDSKVTIEKLTVVPFNQVALHGAVITDRSGNDTILKADFISAGISLKSLLIDEEIVISHAILRELDARIWRAAPDSALNIQHIIAALQPKDPSKPPTKFKFAANAIIIRQCQFSYDVKSEPRVADKFDPNHINVTRLSADIALPDMRNDDFLADVRRLALEEHSGFVLDQLVGRFHASAHELSFSGLDIKLPDSNISLADNSIAINGWRDIKDAVTRRGATLTITEGSYLNPSDLRAFVPVLGRFDEQFPINLSAQGNIDHLNIAHLNIGSQSSSLFLTLSGSVDNPTKPRELSYQIDELEVGVDGRDAVDLGRQVANIPDALVSDIINLGDIHVEAYGRGSLNDAEGWAKIEAVPGSIEVDADWSSSGPGAHRVKAQLSSPGLDLGAILHREDFGEFAGNINVDGALNGRSREGTIVAELQRFTYHGYTYSDIRLDSSVSNDLIDMDFNLNDPNGSISLNGNVNLDPANPSAELHASIQDFNPARANLWNKYPAHSLSANISAEMSGKNLESGTGYVTIRDFSYINPSGSGLVLDEVVLDAYQYDNARNIELSSDIIDGKLVGNYNFATLVPQVKSLIAHVLPILVSDTPHDHHNHEASATAKDNDFRFSLTIRDTDRLRQLVKLPIAITKPLNIEGTINYAAQNMQLDLEAPLIRHGNKQYENTELHASINGMSDDSQLYFTSDIPTKDGMMSLVLNNTGVGNRVDSRVNWFIDRARDYSGDLQFSTLIGRDDEGKMTADVTFNRSQMVFNDSVWTVHPATILYRTKDITVKGLNVSGSNQFVKIDGRASTDPDDIVTVNLKNVNLDYIFEALGLSNVTLGGDVTGELTARDVFSSQPDLHTNRPLQVDSISWNKCVFGNAEVASFWDNARQSVRLDAVIHQPNKRLAHINGDIFATRDSLDLRFKCDKTRTGFLKTYTQAFCSEVSGYMSGWARIWGNFKDIDLMGEVFAEDLKMKIDVINAVYTVTDSVTFDPGRINLDNITVHDAFGHTAKLNGEVTHTFFRDPCFDIEISDARRMLVFDVPEKRNPDWYGHIFGNGHASIVGKPGRIDISAAISSAPDSWFTFVLNNRRNANEYTFLKFRDIQAELQARADELQASKDQQQTQANVPQPTSTYKLSLDMEVNPDLKLSLVMDPAGGDRITSNGNGNLFLSYDSSDQDLVMRGDYTLERGTYNFTLQDIIVRDFTMKPGSSVTFKGDPYSAVLDLQAVYGTNANLSDLDESFLYDKELNRTNVPVQALLNVHGDMRNPDISFDLAFPTLSSDIYRKVKSIVSTDDMMNRQIVYLLALNRFYTPEYMAATTRGNELVSVASSTLSSQLGNMLGQLTDKFTIAPNVRSSKGDFSDVEFDVALSSQLLNNRLLFNGNFGYRDKSLNSTQFVGDFDLEYLLNRSGNIRLKAYNRYNDQNFYIKTATTTQGVGIVFRRDFDNIFSFLRPLRFSKPKPRPAAQPADTTAH